MGQTKRRMEDSAAEHNVDFDDLAKRIQRRILINGLETVLVIAW